MSEEDKGKVTDLAEQKRNKQAAEFVEMIKNFLASWAEGLEETDVDYPELQIRLTTLFYLLMRDKLPVGDVNSLVKHSLKAKPVFSDEVLQRKAESLVEMMLDGQYLVREVGAEFTMPDEDVLHDDDGDDEDKL